MIKNQEYLQSKILIVDDQPSNVMLLEQTLKQAGFTSVIGLTDSLKTIDTYNDFQPDVVLLDLNMPNMDGFEVMAALSSIEKDSYIPVLVLTAVDHPQVRLRALDAGAKDFLGKPFNIPEVLCRIRNMLEVRLLHNQIRGHNEKLEDQVRIRTQELEQTRLEIIHRLGRAGEYRDNETGNHVIRMSQFSAMLAEEAGWSKDQIELILHASPMHDIGKIGIPDSVLLKPGKLDAEEWEIMKTHVEKGVEILEGNDSTLMTMAQTIIAHHHEKFDGSGYPKGLVGDEISEAGQIVAIADVFDALTSERPYKKAWPIEKAMDLLEEQKGKHFNPKFVDLFKNVLPRALKVREKFTDMPEEDALT